jgi:hypothetical protein
MPQPLPSDGGEAAPLAVVRYGLAKEIRLYPDALTFVEKEEGEVNRFNFATIRRISLQPGEKIPSKLVLLVELEDGTAVIAAEGMTNVRDFGRMLPLLHQYAPDVELDPPDMDEQLVQAVVNRRQTNLGCFLTVLVSFGLVALLCVIGNFVRTLGH